MQSEQQVRPETIGFDEIKHIELFPVEEAPAARAGDFDPPKQVSGVLKIEGEDSVPFVAGILDRATRNDTLAPEDVAQIGQTAEKVLNGTPLAEVKIEVPDFPAEFLAEFTKAKLNKWDVREALTFFRSEISVEDIRTRSRAIVVTDASQTDLMKEARTLRLQLRKSRLGIEDQRKEAKEPHLRRIQAIDGTAKILKDLLAEEEAYLYEQEAFVELVESKRLDALEIDRINRLKPYVEGSGVSVASFGSLRGMSEGIFDSVLAGAKARFEQEEEELKTTERLSHILTRERQLSALGFVIVPETKSYDFEDLTVTELQIENLDALAWDGHLRNLSQLVELRKDAKRKIEAERVAETARLQKIEDDRVAAEKTKAEEERVAALAPDKEKVLELLRKAGTLPLPEVQSEEAKQLCVEFFNDLDYLINGYKEKAEKLGSDMPF